MAEISYIHGVKNMEKDGGLKMDKIKIIILIALVAVMSAGCINSTPKEVATPTQISVSPTSTPALASSTVSQDKETGQNLETRIKTLESQVSELNEIIKHNGMMRQSSKNILPEPPFEILIHFKKNMSYIFYPNGIVEMTYKDIIPIKASYEVFYNNNTIKIYPKNGTAGVTFTDNEFDFYWLRFFDDYAVSTYENGWVEWAAKYDIRTDVTSKWEEIKN